MTQQWHVIATFDRPGEVDDDQREALAGALPGFGIVTDDGQRRLQVEGDVEAGTIRQATDAGLKAVRAAWAEAFGVAADPVGLRVLTTAAHEEEIAHPAGSDLIGYTEIAQMLGVSKQRAGQLAELTDFPAPLASPAMGPIYTRGAVEVWASSWTRKPGRPRKTPAE